MAIADEVPFEQARAFDHVIDDEDRSDWYRAGLFVPFRQLHATSGMTVKDP